jgi:hypothetical protein
MCVSALFLLLLIACHTNAAAQPPDPAQARSTATLTATITTTLATTGAVRAPIVLFATPPPVRAEEPLTGASRNVPSVFEGVTDYHPVQATLAGEDLAPSPLTSPAEAAAAVVQIRRCDDFGCDTPAGSGVLIHSSGLILTAYHVLLTDPEDPTSPRYTDFVIALSDNPRSAPQPRYRARLAAEKNEQDLALLAIDRDAAGATIDAGQLNLPALPLADISTLFAADLHVLGYPVSGGEGVSYDRTSFNSFDDGGRLIVVEPAPDPGASGGPALVQQDGRLAIAGLVIRRRSTGGQLSQQGLLRAIDQLPGLTWTPRVARAWGEEVSAGVQISGTSTLLQLALRLNTLDMVGRPLRLLFYATDAASGQPWQPSNAAAPLVVWTDVTPQQVIERRSLMLTMPLEDLGALPDRLRFHALLWEMEGGRALWDDADGAEVGPGVPSISTPPPSSAPTATPPAANTRASTATQPATATIAPTATQTPDVAATRTGEAAEFATAVAATLTAQPTLTPSPTETPDIAQMLATAVAETLTAQPSPTPTATPTPPQPATAVIDSQVNVRQGPGTDYAIIGTATQGQRFPITGKNQDGSWWQIDYNGQIGWITSQLVTAQDVGAVPVAQNIPTPLATHTPTLAPTATSMPTSCPIPVDADLVAYWSVDLGCAVGQSKVVWATFSPYERGMMMWRDDTKMIYGFFDGNGWRAVPDRFTEGMPEKPVPGRGEPPPGLLHPVRGTGLVWATDDTFFQNLGWLRVESIGFCAKVQDFAQGAIWRDSGFSTCSNSVGQPRNSNASDPGFEFGFVKMYHSGQWFR